MERRNRIKCAKCGEVIESITQHDFKECKCGAVFVDGGNCYMRGGGEPINIVDMTSDEPRYGNPETNKWDLAKPIYSKDELEVVNRYIELSRLNKEIKSSMDAAVYVYVKIMFEHPLVDGNKRLATKYLLNYLGVDQGKINEICESLAKEIA